MIYPLVDWQKWAKMYGLNTDEVVCPKCGISQALKNPVAFEHWRGLEADIHSCGPTYQASIFKTIDRERIKIWNELQVFLNKE